jgi:hypothetical protein
MPIYPDLNLVFVHIPKTAGGAIEELLQPYKAPGRKTVVNRLIAKLPIQSDIMRAYIPGHATARYLRSRMGRKTWEAYTSFAVVRNPYEQAISAFEFERQTPRHHRHKRTRKMSFEDYVADRSLAQSRFVCDRDGRVIVDHLIRFETLHLDLDAFFEQRGVTERLPRAGNKNTSQKKAIETYLTATALRTINEKCATDFEVLNYKMIS